MSFASLAIFLPKGQRIGVLFRYNLSEDAVTTRFVADEKFVKQGIQPTVSVSYLADSPEDQAALWRDFRAPSMNGRYSNKNGWLLPAFFQNLLPEGVFRDRIAELRQCRSDDHFEMLAACGKDLPGGLYALPTELTREELGLYVGEGNDALEMSVVEEPMEEGVSLSGVQPKVGVNLIEGRYVGRTKDADTHVIAKLPVVSQPMLPEVEELSLRLAQAAGVNICSATLQPLETLAVQHGYDLGDADSLTKFLAVRRFDRTSEKRIHCEDFAQVLGIMPEDKYGAFNGEDRTSYLDVAAVLLSFESMGEPAVHELLRRLVVNELLGNPDMHLKNIGLLFLDGVTPILSPAYDIVAYSAFNKNSGHALQILPRSMVPQKDEAQEKGSRQKQRLSPGMVRAFCQALDIVEAPAMTAIRDAVRKAYDAWPQMIADAGITSAQKERLFEYLKRHPMIQSLDRRHARGSGSPSLDPSR
ncbi:MULTISPECIES: type II toxin-antitoxin system HipA family toxin [unclassified Roseateles]|uniref:type II toxin-antitoxin system HipA family toxin n=1 Tax=unclassified Roseateles TaxID=2626991 RepID=UPI0006F41290|nr:MULTISPECIES: type II toxin-antitoxin system HipA family toxin [unclassified Roseateles]KQW44831.1 phosphatidylinositol kinase [Pelomonas sp. Root405]KRA70190.1 phosphatidylinositol kinase [Pelomonas sp. Root662]